MVLRKKIRFAAWILLAALVLGLTAPAVSAKTIGREDHEFVEPKDYEMPMAPTINSDTAIVVELNSGVVLYSKNINQRMYPASLTKVMTALLTLENCQLDDTLTLSHNSIYDLVEGGQDSRGRFYEGQQFTIRDALYALCLNSVNTIGYALAEKIDGSLPAFSNRMNERARELGAINTTINNPHGLNDLSHMTSAYDMAKIMWGAIENDLYREIAGTRLYTFQDTDGHTIECLHNYLVFQPTSDYYDPRVVDGKTGWVEEAEYTRVVYATDGNLDIICATFHADTTDWAYRDVRALLDYAFGNFSLVQLPTFGDNGTMTSMAADGSTGEQYKVIYTAGTAKTVTGAAVLVPNSYVDREWTTQIVTAENGMEARVSLGGVRVASYPLSVSVSKVASPTKSTEETTGAPEITQPQPPESTGSSSGLPTLPDGRSDPTKESQPSGESKSSGKGWLIAALVVVTILLVVSILAAFVLAYQNRILKKRVNRRQAIKKSK